MRIKKLFQVFILILIVAFIGSCGVSNESSNPESMNSSFSLEMGKTGSFVTQDGVKVTIETPASTVQTGKVEVREFDVAIKNNPLIEKVSEGLVINITADSRSNLDQKYLAKPIKVTLEYPLTLKDKIKRKSVRLYRLNEDEKTFEIYPASFKDGKIYFEVMETGTFKFLVIDNKLIPPIPEKTIFNELQNERSVGYELPSLSTDVRDGPIAFSYPITNRDEKIVFYMYNPELLKLSQEVIEDPELLKAHLSIKIDDEEVTNFSTFSWKSTLSSNNEERIIEITIRKRIEAGKHLLKVYTHTNYCFDVGGGVGGGGSGVRGLICDTYYEEAISTYFIV
jgi:hypothetical protein